MFNIGNSIINLVISLTAVWIVNRFWKSFFEKKRTSFISVAVCVLYCGFQILFQCKRGNINLFLSFINVILVLLMAVCRYHCAGKRKYFLLLLYFSVGTLLEELVFFLLRVLGVEQHNQYIECAVISNILMIIFVYVVSAMWNKVDGEMIPNKFYLFLLIIPMGSIYISFNEFYGRNNGLSSTIIVSILLLFNVVIFEIYIKTNEVFMYEKERTVYAQQVGIVSENMIEQKKMLEEFQVEKHNMINELVVLRGNIENGDRESAIRNLNKIIHNWSNTENILNSGNSTVDAIINFKYTTAKEYGIDFRLKVFIPNELPIEQSDVGVVLGNAIDNAIEAVRKCESSKKVIEISMGVKKEAWVVVIKNPYETEIKRDRNGNILSTKTKEYRRGYGLKSIERIIEKYQGEIIIDTEHGRFSLTMVLNFEEF